MKRVKLLKLLEEIAGWCWSAQRPPGYRLEAGPPEWSEWGSPA